MARKLRIEYPGAIYHVMNRGDRREDIFRDDKDRESFIATLAEAFREDCWAQVEERRGASHYGEELQESATEKTERLVRKELEKLRWTEADLDAPRKGDRAKLKLTVKLRAETTMTLKWIAVRLQMGPGASLSNLLSAQRRKGR